MVTKIEIHFSRICKQQLHESFPVQTQISYWKNPQVPKKDYKTRCTELDFLVLERGLLASCGFNGLQSGSKISRCEACLIKHLLLDPSDNLLLERVKSKARGCTPHNTVQDLIRILIWLDKIFINDIHDQLSGAEAYRYQNNKGRQTGTIWRDLQHISTGTGSWNNCCEIESPILPTCCSQQAILRNLRETRWSLPSLFSQIRFFKRY